MNHNVSTKVFHLKTKLDNIGLKVFVKLETVLNVKTLDLTQLKENTVVHPHYLPTYTLIELWNFL